TATYLILMYQFLHPCADNVDAALSLFYDYDGYSPHVTEWLPPMLDHMKHDPEYYCVQYLIEHFKMSCTHCSMLECLLSAHVEECPDGQSLCLTSVVDGASGRNITRGCTDEAYCNQKFLIDTVGNSDCKDVENRILPSGTTCNFCCHGTNCNAPPSLEPDSSALYHRP
ncbi:hypothetical protein BaRGS_00012353, partial [Batillaria attramentaria]